MKKRFIFSDLKDHLVKPQITILIGARQTGKTTLLRQLSDGLQKEREPTEFISLEDPFILAELNKHPDKLFEFIQPLNDIKKTNIFIDEIQYLDDPSNFLKYHFDLYKDKIKLIVSGSSSFYIDKKFKDSLAGRKKIFNILTLSFEELLYFKDKTDLLEMVKSGKIPLLYRKEIDKLVFEYLLYGGYPDVVLANNLENKRQILKELANSYVKKDAIEAKIKLPDLYLKMMITLSAQIGSLVNTNKLSANFQIDNSTVNLYLRLMRQSFHVSLINPFFNNRPKELRKMSKIYFNDLGLRNYFIDNFDPIGIRNDKGALFENFVFRRFLDHCDDDEIRYWRTQKKQEVDFIIKGKQAFEVKYSEDQFNPAKYAYFKTSYPDLPLKLIHFGNIFKSPHIK